MLVIPVKQPAIHLNEKSISNSTGVIYKFSGHESERPKFLADVKQDNELPIVLWGYLSQW